jgi:macrolide-specific efflux system membrane fusion protein
MNANLTIVTAEVTNAIEVPTTAIVSAGRGSFVRTLDAKNTEALTPVQTGVSDATYTQIVSGLSVGERIVVPTTSASTTTATSATGARGFGGAGGFGGGGGFGGAVRIGG